MAVAARDTLVTDDVRRASADRCDSPLRERITGVGIFGLQSGYRDLVAGFPVADGALLAGVQGMLEAAGGWCREVAVAFQALLGSYLRSVSLRKRVLSLALDVIDKLLHYRDVVEDSLDHVAADVAFGTPDVLVGTSLPRIVEGMHLMATETELR
jgi:hypothetical protein